MSEALLGEYGVVVAIPIGFPKERLGPVGRRPAAALTCFDSWGNLDPKDWK